jgi:hypothetical protein
MRQFTFAPAVIVLLFQIAQTQTITRDEYRLYALAFNNIRKEARAGLKNEYLVILSVAQNTDEPVIDRSERFKGMLADYRRKNISLHPINPALPSLRNYSLIEKIELDGLLDLGRLETKKKKEIGSRGGKPLYNAGPCGDAEQIWQPFYAKFPKSAGYYKVSRIGFSTNRKAAILTIIGEGADWDGNWTYILIKIQRGWRVYIGSGGFGAC